MPKYWGGNYFAHGSFLEVGQKQKTEKMHASTHGARKPPGPKERKKEEEEERTMVITMDKLRMAHASTHGARKPPGPILSLRKQNALINEYQLTLNKG